jgi:hypothetical protein
VQAYAWFVKNARPHLPRAPVDHSGPHKKRYNRETIAAEDCRVSEPDDWTYQSNQQKIRYIYNDKEYSTTINRWKQAKHRPHLCRKNEIEPSEFASAFKSCGCEIVEPKHTKKKYDYNVWFKYRGVLYAQPKIESGCWALRHIWISGREQYMTMNSESIAQTTASNTFLNGHSKT